MDAFIGQNLLVRLVLDASLVVTLLKYNMPDSKLQQYCGGDKRNFCVLFLCNIKKNTALHSKVQCHTQLELHQQATKVHAFNIF